jgi:prepilin-type N-terminal cleavage/methylation domain-containing protein
MNNNREDGFTLLEALAAMGVISIVLTVLALAFTSSAAALEKSKDTLIFGVKLLRADSLIRNRVGAIAVPYWENLVPEAGSSSLTIPWYRGKHDAKLRLSAEDHALILETEGAGDGERITIIDSLDGAELSILRDDQQNPYGIGISYFYKQNTYHSFSAFASHPLGRIAVQ